MDHLPVTPRRIQSRETIFRGRKYSFERIIVESRNGRPVAREVVRHPGAVCILPVHEGDGGLEVITIRNDRPAVGRLVLELPAGTLEPDEPPIRCAARELVEETGYEAATLRPLGSFYTTPGLTDELMHAFIATRLRHVGQALEPDEHITVEPMRVDDLLEAIDEGTMVDGKSMLTVLMAVRMGFVG